MYISETTILLSTTGGKFTDIFTTDSFRGSMEVISKLSFVGTALQFVISAFAFIGVVAMVFRIMCSFLYLASPATWDEVAEIKSERPDKDLLGMFTTVKPILTGKRGTGVDALVSLFLSILPDIRHRSDFKDENGKFKRDMGFLNYVVTIALSTFAGVFFFAMAYNGTLFNLLGKSVDALGGVADRIVEVEYSTFLEQKLNTVTGYQFASGADGTEQGNLRQNISKRIYAKIMPKLTDPDRLALDAIGANIEGAVQQLITSDNLVGKGNINITKEIFDSDDSVWKCIGFEIRVSSLDTYSTSNALVISGTLGEWCNGTIKDASLNNPVLGTNVTDAEPTQYLHLVIKQVKNPTTAMGLKQAE